MIQRHFLGIFASILAAGAMIACNSPAEDFTPPVPVVPSPYPTIADLGYTIQLGYTHHRADGNRVAEGKGPFPGGSVVDIPIDGSPGWVVGTALDEQTL